MSQSFQLLTGDGEFLESSIAGISSWSKSAKSQQYSLVSIMGAQSSGKSTLLNHLFGTRFDVMDASTGRNRTTIGTWLGKSATPPEFASNERTLLILDAEGTDSRERGDTSRTYENQSSLFSLALSEVVIINLWEHDIGRHNASNYSIISTVFEAATRLFLQSGNTPKTLILFIIRDHIGKTPLSKYVTLLTNDMHQIWKDIAKPDDMKDDPINRFFDFEFVCLPHYELQTEQFHASVKALQERFFQPNNQSIFTKEREKSVPFDGFGLYAQNVWNEIQEDRVLDLPSQREILSNFRCSALVADTINQVRNDLNLLEQHILKPGWLRLDLGAIFDLIEKDAVEAYSALAQNYQTSVFEEKKTELKDQLKDLMQPLYTGHLSILRKKCEQLMTRDLNNLEKPKGEAEKETVKFAIEDDEDYIRVRTHFISENAASIATSPLSNVPLSGQLSPRPLKAGSLLSDEELPNAMSQTLIFPSKRDAQEAKTELSTPQPNKPPRSFKSSVNPVLAAIELKNRGDAHAKARKSIRLTSPINIVGQSQDSSPEFSFVNPRIVYILERPCSLEPIDLSSFSNRRPRSVFAHTIDDLRDIDEQPVQLGRLDDMKKAIDIFVTSVKRFEAKALSTQLASVREGGENAGPHTSRVWTFQQELNELTQAGNTHLNTMRKQMIEKGFVRLRRFYYSLCRTQIRDILDQAWMGDYEGIARILQAGKKDEAEAGDGETEAPIIATLRAQNPWELINSYIDSVLTSSRPRIVQFLKNINPTKDELDEVLERLFSSILTVLSEVVQQMAQREEMEERGRKRLSEEMKREIRKKIRNQERMKETDNERILLDSKDTVSQLVDKMAQVIVYVPSELEDDDDEETKLKMDDIVQRMNDIIDRRIRTSPPFDFLAERVNSNQEQQDFINATRSSTDMKKMTIPLLSTADLDAVHSSISRHSSTDFITAHQAVIQELRESGQGGLGETYLGVEGGGTPLWMYLLLLFLGWDKLSAAMKNPYLKVLILGALLLGIVEFPDFFERQWMAFYGQLTSTMQMFLNTESGQNLGEFWEKYGRIITRLAKSLFFWYPWVSDLAAMAWAQVKIRSRHRKQKKQQRNRRGVRSVGSVSIGAPTLMKDEARAKPDSRKKVRLDDDEN
ncbi:putative SEY1 like protein [Blattamonas nauphoetae]|uniref:SEY1 like protein n=1 Tax=Blattamonas nauphoetae TaxID=2049346 RepID=A0ABQ9Y663_9EUKA|nr:putative SEY1 like protein [Blattamonas nauphoetae]